MSEANCGTSLMARCLRAAAFAGFALGGCSQLHAQQVNLPPNLTLAPRAEPLTQETVLIKCQAKVTFHGKPRNFTPAELLALAKPFEGISENKKFEIDGLINDRNGLQEGAVCICANFRLDPDRSRAMYIQTGSVVADVSPIEGFRKAFSWDAPDLSKKRGHRTRTIQAYPEVNSNCFVGVTVAYQDELPAEGRVFIATLRQHSPGVNSPIESQSASSSKQSASLRLTELKDLFDRGLITKQEYDTKRKVILDEL